MTLQVQTVQEFLVVFEMVSRMLFTKSNSRQFVSLRYQSLQEALNVVCCP